MDLEMLLVGSANTPYFRANDVGALLGYSQPAVAINRIFKNGFGCTTYKDLILLGVADITDINKLRTRYINEDGVYLLISRLPFTVQQSVLSTKVAGADRLRREAWLSYFKQVASHMIDSSSKQEAIIRDRVAAGIPGSKVEVRCDTGFVDIETPAQIIEVKRDRNYKGAIGQIIVYGLSFPTKTRRVHFFTSTKDFKDVSLSDKIKTICTTLDIVATFEDSI